MYTVDQKLCISSELLVHCVVHVCISNELLAHRVYVSNKQ